MLTVCLLLTVVSVSALADGCKWHGETLKYTVSSAAAVKTYNVNCDSTYTVDIQFDENPLYPTSRGYVNNWAKVSYSNKSQLKLSFEKNYSSSRRSCKVILTCDTHYSTKTLVITQNAGTDKTPTISLSTSRITAAPGGQVQFKITSQNSRRVFVDMMTSGIQTYNIPYSTSTSKSTKNISFNVPQSTSAGVYRLYIEASNSPKANDAWARRTSKKYVDVLVQAPVSAPVIKNANTGAVLYSNQTIDYNPEDGDLSLSWSAENGCGYYKVVIIGLNEAPDFGDSSQLSRAVYKLMNTNKTRMASIKVNTATMKKAQYIKIAIGAYQSQTDSAPVKWTNVGVRITQGLNVYNVQKMIDYAYQNATVHCASHPGADCAHFTAQCVAAGGIKVINSSTYYTENTKRLNGKKMGEYRNPYIASGAQLKWFYDNNYKVIVNPSQSQMNIGDLVCTYGSGVNDGHIMIITGYNQTYGYTACGHTTYRKDFPIRDSATYLIKINYSNEGLKYHTNYDWSEY